MLQLVNYLSTLLALNTCNTNRNPVQASENKNRKHLCLGLREYL